VLDTSRNADDPLNKGTQYYLIGTQRSVVFTDYSRCPLLAEAAEDLRRNREIFARNVATSLRGGSVNGVTFDRVLAPGVAKK
jgi:hypothetical protein